MPKKYTVKVNYEAIVSAIDNHKVYRGNNTSFCLDMGFENRTSWVSDLKRGRNLPSPEEAARMCILLKTTPDEILLHDGETPEETAKCLQDIETVRKLVEAEAIKETPDPKIEGYSELQQAAIQFVLSLPPDKLERFVKMGRAAFEEGK
jgi:hypothetical protein